MKLFPWLSIVFASLTFTGPSTALAESNVEPDAVGLTSETATSEPKLSAQTTLKRIANETGGTYVFKPDGSVEDYRDHFNKMLEKALNGNDATQKMDSP